MRLHYLAPPEQGTAPSGKPGQAGLRIVDHSRESEWPKNPAL